MAQRQPLTRSRAGVDRFEEIQIKEYGQPDDPRDKGPDRAVLRDIAQRQLLVERRVALQAGTGVEHRATLADLVGRPEHLAEVEARARDLEHYDLGADGDIWSRYERPDHRRRLSELVVTVEEAALLAGYEIPRRPVIGTLPTHEINAQARTGPPDAGHLVAFETGLFAFAEGLAGTAAQALDARPADGGSTLRFLPEEAVEALIAARPGLVVQFADLVFSHVVLGSCGYATVGSPAPEHAGFAGVVADAVLTFALAHEYAHVILGHVDLDRPAADRAGRHRDEFAADGVGLDVSRTALKGPHWAFAGATLFLSGALAMDRLAAQFRTGRAVAPLSPTHPPADGRLGALLNRLAGAPSAQAEHARTLGRVLAFAVARLCAEVAPAFELARRGGYPRPGFRPASEQEQHAALLSFIAPLGLCG